MPSPVLGKGMLVKVLVDLYSDIRSGSIAHIKDIVGAPPLYQVRGKWFQAEEIEYYVRKPGDKIDLNV